MIAHVALETRPADADAAVAFWTLLGFAEVAPPGTLGERSRWLRRDGVEVHLLLADDAVAPPQGHVALDLGGAEAYADAVTRLRAAGAEVDPRPEHWGAPRCFVRAPGGHRVELMAYRP